ncbi:hypothetical protein BRCON_2849 [Candidatus Sumerlaea chitinivorans]|uniref:Uncharacterized protein n=1 Tax=Sumerlaea chitinivorans TaxID=2250252 RepID=A0A2Z4Y8N2_SUMC1|nr:hypothetical protein BRCON_2849 [Candidatus Sumerlaea chitinivorans]
MLCRRLKFATCGHFLVFSKVAWVIGKPSPKASGFANRDFYC